MPRIFVAPRLAAATVIHCRMRLAQLMELPESDLEGLARRLEADPLFGRLVGAGVIIASAFPAARFAARRFAGYGLRMESSGLPELVDGNCDLVRLMQDVGQERFQQWFLGESAFADEERACGCGISIEDARRLRAFMDRAFIQGEFEGPAAPAPEMVFSAVAGIEIEGGEPVLAFFHREVWKKRYLVNEERLAEYLHSLPQSEAAEVESLLGSLKFIEQRKTTLYRLLEEVLRIQADYLSTGDPMRRRPLMQKAMAVVLGVHPSVVCRLISNKSVQMPWGLEVPLGVFFPNDKDINRERLGAIACAQPELRDQELGQALESRYGVRLSRRSVNQYRQEVFLKKRLH